MSSQAADLARCLARDAEAVCRHYLPNGRRRGRYWVVGDVANTPGRSLFVRLTGPDSGKGAAGKWTDAATGQHGDLLDLIALNQGLDHLRDVLDEARCFLSLPSPEPPPNRFSSLLKNSKSDVRCAIFESKSLMVVNLSCVAQTGLESMLPIATPQKPFSANC